MLHNFNDSSTSHLIMFSVYSLLRVWADSIIANSSCRMMMAGTNSIKFRYKIDQILLFNDDDVGWDDYACSDSLIYLRSQGDTSVTIPPLFTIQCNVIILTFMCKLQLLNSNCSPLLRLVRCPLWCFYLYSDWSGVLSSAFICTIATIVQNRDTDAPIQSHFQIQDSKPFSLTFPLFHENWRPGARSTNRRLTWQNINASTENNE